MNKHKVVILLVLLALIPNNYLAMEVVYSLSRDNFHYNNFHMSLLSSDSIIVLFSRYTNLVGASEPLYFLFFFFLAKVGLGYEHSILLTNISFSFVIACAVAKLKLKKHTLVLVLLYLLSDYYLFVLFSEAHRLKLAMIFCLASIFIFQKLYFKIISFTLMLLSHFQSGFLLLLGIKRVTINNFILGGVIALGLLPFYNTILNKLLFYIGLNDPLSSFLSSISLVTLFLSLIIVINNMRVSRKYITAMILLILLSSILGKLRINIFIFEISTIYLFYLINKLHSVKIGLYTICFFSILIIGAYHMVKILQQYKNLMVVG